MPPVLVVVRYRDGERSEAGDTLASRAPLVHMEISGEIRKEANSPMELSRFPLGAEVYVRQRDGRYRFGVVTEWIS